MRFPFVASLILSGVVISAMRASAQDSAELKKKLTAEQKEIAEVLIACEEKLLALEKWLERSESLTDQQIAKHLKRVRDSAKASAAFQARRTVELLAAANLDNLGDLAKVLDHLREVTLGIEAATGLLATDQGPRAQRQSFGISLATARSMAKAQTELGTLNITGAPLGKAQARIRQQTEQLAAALTAEGNGKGKIGKHLQNARSSLSETINIQKEVERFANKGGSPKALKRNLDAVLKLQRTVSELENVVKFAQVLEHQATLKNAVAEVERILASIGRFQQQARDLATTIARRPNKRADRIDKLAGLKLADAVQMAKSEAVKSLAQIDPENQLGALKIGFVGALGELDGCARRLELSDLGDETFGRLKKSTATMTTAKAAIQETQRLLAALEPGELKAPNLDEVRECARGMEKALAGQRKLAMQIQLHRNSQLGGPLLLFPPEKKKTEKK